MKVIRIVFVIFFIGMLSLPYVFADRGGTAVSKEENRALNQRPSFIEAGTYL